MTPGGDHGVVTTMMIDRRQGGDFPDWTVCADTEGHQFCIHEHPA